MRKTFLYLPQYIKSAVIIILLGTCTLSFVLWHSYLKDQEKMANNEIFQAVYQFEAGNYDKALHGGEEYLGFLEMTEKYKYTKTRNLAHLYAGICYLHQANYTAAISYLEKYKTSNTILKARARSLIGDAYLEQGLYDKALTYYLKAAQNHHNEEYAPIYWIKAAEVYNLQEAYEEALRCYKIIEQYYHKSRCYPEIKKHIQRLKEKVQHVEKRTPDQGKLR